MTRVLARENFAEAASDRGINLVIDLAATFKYE